MPSSTTLLNQTGSALSGAVQDGFTLGSARRPDGTGGAKRPIPHIDDILAVEVNLSPDLPIDKVLKEAELYLKQAQSSLSFGRTVEALKDFLYATSILVRDIKLNKHWVLLQHDNKHQYQRYQQFLRQLSEQAGDYEKIKADIKTDNARTGVRPTVERTVPAGNQHLPLESAQVGRGGRGPLDKADDAPGRPAPSIPKQKPAVRPKPEALHGNALQSTQAANDALAQRFAKLRPITANTPMQDPRIRTHPLIPPNIPAPVPAVAPKPPVEPPPPAPVPVASTLGLPKLPDAIYLSARGTVSSEAAELPSSAPRTMFTRTNSAGSIQMTSKQHTKPPPVLEEVFVPALSFSHAEIQPDLPPGNIIHAHELYKCMQQGSNRLSILIIDIRGRDRFDEGHILSQATICFDPEVLSRENISAMDIVDSNVIAPTTEQLLFEQRFQFGLVVFYDEDSVTIPDYPTKTTQRAITGLYKALTQYDYNELNRVIRPRLLTGGIESWIALLGRGSLERTSTQTTTRAMAPLARSFLVNQRPGYMPRSVPAADEAKPTGVVAEDSLRQKQTVQHESKGQHPIFQASGEAQPTIGTIEDFLRRKQTTPQKESMSQGPIVEPLAPREDDFSTWPPPPRRPAPTFPGLRYSGLSDSRTEDANLSNVPRAGSSPVKRGRIGIHNPSNWCYGISLLQALFATPGFSRDIWSGEWLQTYRNLPRKTGETHANKQLFMKKLQQTFTMLRTESSWSDSIKIDDFMALTKTKHMQREPTVSERDAFGGNIQHDVHDFASFLLGHVDDETNMRRDHTMVEPKMYTSNDGTISQNALDYWRLHRTYMDSILDRYFRSLEVNIRRCSGCPEERDFADGWHTALRVQQGDSDTVEFAQLLARYFAPGDPFRCTTCLATDRMQQARYARMPDRLVFMIARFGATSKLKNKVRFPTRNLDLTRYFVDPDQTGASSTDRHFSGPMIYDCYAVVVHSGNTLNSGHYYAFVQDEQSRDPTDWWECNDHECTRVKIDSQHPNDDTEKMYQRGTAHPYLLFYKRQGT